jgi:hypothetical protein
VLLHSDGSISLREVILETKPAYLTSEFWLTIFLNIGGLLNITGAWDYAPHRWVVVGIAIVNGLYFASRGLSKSGIAYDPVAALNARNQIRQMRSQGK